MTTALCAEQLSASRAFHRHRDGVRRRASEAQRRERLAAAFDKLDELRRFRHVCRPFYPNSTASEEALHSSR